ncbi:MAG: DUF5606 domain-containing protein [Flavobacteriales bacterium]|nr:DUF5606 domain-containing protein [Flavobacteriales bacterium]
MDLAKIISVTGKSGLFRVVAQGRQAVIAESLEDGKRIPVHSSVRVSTLDEISMFTTGDDEPLKNILAKLFEKAKGGDSVDPKSDDATLWKALAEVLPTADRERIYASDVRKLFLWYSQLHKAGLLAKKEEKKEEEGDDKLKDTAKGKKVAAKGAKTKTASAGKKAGSQSAGPPKAAAPRRGGQRGA